DGDGGVYVVRGGAREVDDAVADGDVAGGVLGAVVEHDGVDALLVRVDDHLVDFADALAVGVDSAEATHVLVLVRELPAAGVRKGYACHRRCRVLRKVFRCNGSGAARPGGYCARTRSSAEVIRRASR